MWHIPTITITIRSNSIPLKIAIKKIMFFLNQNINSNLNILNEKRINIIKPLHLIMSECIINVPSSNLSNRSMPPSPKVRNVTENNVIQQEGDKVTAPVSSASYGANIKIISNVSSPAGQRTVMKTNQIKSIHNLTVTTQERKPVLVDTPISLRTSKNETVKCSGGVTGVTLPAGTQVIPSSNHQVYYSGIITSTCATPTTSVATIPKTAILMPHGHYALLNTGMKGSALVTPGGSSPMQVTNVMVKTNPAVPVGTQSGITKGVSVGSGQPTHVQYLVPSFTPDGKLILPNNLLVSTDPAAKQLTVTPVSSAGGGVRMVPSTGGAATSDAGSVIKPIAVTEVAKTSVTSQAQGMVLISGSRSGIAPVGPQLGVSQPVSLAHSPYQTHPAGESYKLTSFMLTLKQSQLHNDQTVFLEQ